MGRKRADAYRNTISAAAQLVVVIVTLVIVYFSYVQTNQSKELFAIFFLFSATFMTDKVAALFAGYGLDRDKLETDRLFKSLPSLLLESSDIVTFSNRKDGINYIVAMLKSAVSVRNTVLRYGKTASATSQDFEYEAMLEAKREALLKNDCPWTEIVSIHIDNDDKVMALISELKGKTRYNVSFIDDKCIPMIQMLMIDYDDREREVIFGWEFPEAGAAPAFSTRNRQVVQYFEKYFDHCRRLASAEKPTHGVQIVD